MSSRRTLPHSTPIDNGRPPEGKAREPDGPADTSFDPAALESPLTQAPAPDPFDPERLRLAQNLDAACGVQEVLLRVPYRKPSKECFFRVHPSEEYRIQGGVIELKEDEPDTYWVDPALWSALADQPTFSPRAIFTAVTQQGAPFLWGCRLPGPDGKVPDWVAIPLEAARQAESEWTKIYWDQSQRRHRVLTAPAAKDEPRWPAQPFKELLRLAFKDKVIVSLDHVVLRKLRGEV
jgi:hypothetical protein